MIHSMTAFIRKEIQNENWIATWEIRSLNQRYLEIQIYLPDTLRSLEIDIRKKINSISGINRGRIECKLHIENSNSNIINNHIILNQQLIEKLTTLIQNIPKKHIIGKIDPIKLLSWPGIIIQKKINMQQYYPKLLESFNYTLSQLIKMRKKEGDSLKKVIQERLCKINYEINNIEKQIPHIIPNQRIKILKKIQELQINVHTHRLEEELIIYAQRSDISEEIDRLKIHIENITDTLCIEKVIGRKLDFIMQEIYREINTITSKSMNIQITQSSIEIKILIDQIREQIQNIE